MSSGGISSDVGAVKVDPADLKHAADDSLNFCAVNFTNAAGNSVDSGTIELTDATVLDTLTGADTFEFS